MPSNKVAVATIVGLILIHLVPMPAAAQEGPADLIVTRIEMPNAIAGVASDVTVYVKNIGGEQFSTNTGWRLFFGWNGSAETDCIDTSRRAPGTGVCYQDIPATDHNLSVIPGNTEEQFTFKWTPSVAQASSTDRINHADYIWSVILSFGSQPGTLQQSPDRPNDGNDVEDHPAFVKDPRVLARPDRSPPPHQNEALVNEAWRLDDILRNDCARPSETEPRPINTVGCQTPPGSLVSFGYFVQNMGNTPDAYRAVVVDDPVQGPDGVPRTLTQRGYKFFFSPDETTPIVQPNNDTYVVVSILVPESERAMFGINNGSRHANIRWSSVLNPEKTTVNSCRDSDQGTNQEDGLCTNPSLPSIVASTKRGVWAGTNESWHEVAVGRSVQLNMTVNNTGNYFDTYHIFVDRTRSTIDDSWLPAAATRNLTGTDGAPGMLPGEVKNATLTLIPPSNVEQGVYRVDLVARSQTDATKEDAATFFVFLKPRFNITGGAFTDIIRVVPDQDASFRFFIDNNGNAMDNVTLTLENVPGNWPHALSTTRASIPAFSRESFTFDIRPPENTVNNSWVLAFVNVTSQGEPDQQESARSKVVLKLNVTVLRGPNFRVATPTPTAFIDPGTTKTFDVSIRNTGNVDDNYTISFERPDPSWGVELSRTDVPLKPLESATIQVTVRAPGAATVGETTKIDTIVTSKVDQTRAKRVNLTARVSGPDLFVDTIGLDRQTPYSGDDIELSITLGNRGNKAPDGNATLRVEFLKDGVPSLIGTQKIYSPSDLPAGLRVTERFMWNTTGVEGPVMLRVRIDPDNSIAEIDDTPSSNEVTLPVTLRTFDIRIVPAQPLSAYPGEEVVYGDEPNVFIVEYRGNQPSEPVRVTLASENGWGSTSAELALTPFTPVALPVTLRVPVEPGVARDTLRLTVTPTLRTGSVLVATTTTTVIDEKAPRFLDVSVTPESATLGQDVTVRTQVVDETGVKEVRAFIVRPGEGNDTEALVMAHEGSGIYSVTQPFDAAGTYRYYLVAVDASTNANQNSTAETVRTFRVSPGSAPVVKLGDNQSTTIRTGVPIALNVTDPLGIAKVNYSIRGISTDLSRPFNEIDTSSFTAGTVDVLVTAENIYGAATTERFTFVIDNTPPTIRGVTISPEAPKINEDVTVRIETDQDAVSVEVAIKRDGQLVATERATKVQGVWQLTFNPGQGENVLDVTAKDAAGNAKTLSGAAKFNAKADGFLGIPGFGLVAAFAAVAIALAMRRRA